MKNYKQKYEVPAQKQGITQSFCQKSEENHENPQSEYRTGNLLKTSHKRYLLEKFYPAAIRNGNFPKTVGTPYH
jgi:hypothetical protein